MGKTKQGNHSTREELNAEYYGMAAQAGDLARKMKEDQKIFDNLLIKMSVALRRCQMAKSVPESDPLNQTDSFTDKSEEQGDEQPAGDEPVV